MRPTPSFEKINYSVRPAKATQRHMLVEAVARLARFAPVSGYRYIGFGSTFFIDFRLLHQRYGITRMHSIEREISKEKRFELNRPFRCVNMLYGDSRKMLLDPKIKWSRGPAIAWLDYDEPLDLTKFADCERVLTHALHGSLLLVTFDAAAGTIKGATGTL